MPDSGLPALLDEAGPAAQLTGEFYAWEHRGRGWQVWPYPVAVEPPFRPFLGHFLPPQTAVDDARKPTLLGGVVDVVRRRFRKAPVNPDWAAAETEELYWEPEPEVFADETRLSEIRVSLPQHVRVTPHLAEQFLLSLTSCAYPLSFEVLGLPNAIIVQMACRASDADHVAQQLRAYFPDAGLNPTENFLARRWRTSIPRLIVDFGLEQEFMRPLKTFPSFEVDPLIGIVGALGDVAAGELALLQVLFEAARNPWPESIVRAVTDSEGRPFFEDAPEMTSLAKEKIERPLCAAVIRVAAQSPEPLRARELVRAFSGSLAPFASPGRNELVALTNADYDFEAHEDDLVGRRTHRSGMILCSGELVSLVHLPSVSVRAEKLAREQRKTRPAPSWAQGHALTLGTNTHRGRTVVVSAGTEQRLRHTHIVGATGTGKSTLLVNLITQDIALGNGVGVIDPHGDLIEEILGRIPDNRAHDVVLFDPSDANYPVGFNILSAHSELEKTILASDLGMVFKRFSTSWGDQMTSLLGNAILAFLESDRGGTLLDLRRFLVEADYRRTYLREVKDPHVRYYWEKEFPRLRGRPEGPVLTRLDTFLRPRLIRNVVAQKENLVRFSEVMNSGRIFLAKLAQGLIGEENAHLMGALLVSKLHQTVMARQEVPTSKRKDFFLYIDEFHHFITPSLASILAGARKYHLGLILAHQDLRQLWNRDTDVASAVISNASTRICFRLGDFDARKLQEGFASFSAQDLQNLGVGEAIARIERADADFNLKTLPLPPMDETRANLIRQRIITLSRQKYARPKQQVAAEYTAASPVVPETPPVAAEPTKAARREAVAAHPRPAVMRAPKEAQAAAPAPPTPGRGGQQHKYLQQLVKRFGADKGYLTTIEKPILHGHGNVDVALERKGLSIACEIAVGSTAERELGNIEKCLAAGFDHVVSLSSERGMLRKVEAGCRTGLSKDQLGRVRFLLPEQFFSFLEAIDAKAAGREETVKGYRVKVRYRPLVEAERKERKRAVAKTIAQALSRLKRGK